MRAVAETRPSIMRFMEAASVAVSSSPVAPASTWPYAAVVALGCFQ